MRCAHWKLTRQIIFLSHSLPQGCGPPTVGFATGTIRQLLVQSRELVPDGSPAHIQLELSSSHLAAFSFFPSLITVVFPR